MKLPNLSTLHSARQHLHWSQRVFTICPGVTDGRITLSQAPSLAECFSRDGKAFHSIFWQVIHNSKPYRQEGESQVLRMLSAWSDLQQQPAPCPAPWIPSSWRAACLRSLLSTRGSSCPSDSAMDSDIGPHGLSVEPLWPHWGR